MLIASRRPFRPRRVMMRFISLPLQLNRPAIPKVVKFEALENLNKKIEGVVTTYDHPYSATDHEAISSNIPVFGLVKGGRVVPAHPEDLEGDKALRIKPKA